MPHHKNITVVPSHDIHLIQQMAAGHCELPVIRTTSNLHFFIARGADYMPIGFVACNVVTMREHKDDAGTQVLNVHTPYVRHGVCQDEIDLMLKDAACTYAAENLDTHFYRLSSDRYGEPGQIKPINPHDMIHSFSAASSKQVVEEPVHVDAASIATDAKPSYAGMNI